MYRIPGVRSLRVVQASESIRVSGLLKPLIWGGPVTDLGTIVLIVGAGPATVYAIHEDGFAGHMARSEEVTRYYLQCRRGEDPEQWSDDRIWSELGRRMLVGPDADQRADPSRVSSVRMSERAGVHPGERRQRDGGTRSLSASKPEREEGGMTAKLNTFLIVRLLTLTASNRRGRHTHRRQATAAS
jgi:hypothetical protein